MAYEFFYINNVSFSDYVDTRSYSVNRQDLIETWTDANYKIHGELVRQRVAGTVTLLFTNATQYNNFVDTLAQNKTSEGKYPIGVHVNSDRTVDMITRFNAFIEFAPKVVYADKSFHRVPVVIQVQCNITEE